MPFLALYTELLEVLVREGSSGLYRHDRGCYYYVWSIEVRRPLGALDSRRLYVETTSLSIILATTTED